MAPPPVDVAEIESSRLALEQAFDHLRDAVDLCVQNFNRIVEGVDEHAWLLGPLPLWFIRNHLDDLRDALKEAITYAEKVLQGGVPVISLFVTSIDYLNAVQSPVSDIAYDINTPQDDNLGYWRGAAALAYRQKQGTQKAAADRAADNAVFMSEWLYKIGKTNVAYAVEVVKLLVDAAAELVNVTVDGISIINVQFALDHAADAVKKLLKAAVNQLVELADKFVATLGDLREVLARRNDHGTFENGRWPQAVYGN
ncbi:hypothetical protein AB0J86_18875 [Micromonospora sp. NPDC049559]|uniref:hypothetical protein n=1 Tax=Micromonospora sp. NPDC049559 TaxID=3155923 RepID=UPI003419BDED